MTSRHSVRFFDAQFQQQSREGVLDLNPFETAALPYLCGRVLELGCGMGNLAFAAARNGCSVVALDASPAAIAHIQQRAASERLSVEAILADLQDYSVDGEFDALVSIGLLMYFDRQTALRTLEKIKNQVRPGGLAVINVLTEGTTYLAIFGSDSRYLFAPGEIAARLPGWELLYEEHSCFDAPGDTCKVFDTVIARKPSASA